MVRRTWICTNMSVSRVPGTFTNLGYSTILDRNTLAPSQGTKVKVFVKNR